MASFKMVEIVGEKFGVKFERVKGFILGLQVKFSKRGGVRISLFGWSMFIGIIPIKQTVSGEVANGDSLDEILSSGGKKTEFSIEYNLSKKSPASRDSVVKNLDPKEGTNASETETHSDGRLLD